LVVIAAQAGIHLSQTGGDNYPHCAYPFATTPCYDGAVKRDVWTGMVKDWRFAAENFFSQGIRGRGMAAVHQNKYRKVSGVAATRNFGGTWL